MTFKVKDIFRIYVFCINLNYLNWKTHVWTLPPPQNQTTFWETPLKSHELMRTPLKQAQSPPKCVYDTFPNWPTGLFGGPFINAPNIGTSSDNLRALLRRRLRRRNVNNINCYPRMSEHIFLRQKIVNIEFTKEKLLNIPFWFYICTHF